MSHWNHRVIKHQKTMSDGEEETWFSIHEVYYNSDGSLQAYTENAVEPTGTTLQELSDDLVLFQKALSRTVLTESDFKNFNDDYGERVPYSASSIPPFSIMDEIEERAAEVKRQEADVIELAAWDSLCLATVHAPEDFVGPLTCPTASISGFAVSNVPIEIDPAKTYWTTVYKTFPVPKDLHEEVSQKETGIMKPCPFCQGRVLPKEEWSTGKWCCDALWRIRCDQVGSK